MPFKTKGSKVKGKLGFSDAAYKILKAGSKPLSPLEITKLAIAKGLIKTESKRPEATMGARLGADNRFVKVSRGKWRLKGEK